MASSDSKPKDDPGRHLLLSQLRAELRRATGRDYQVDFERLESCDLLELIRMVRELVGEAQSAACRAKLSPWR